MSTDPAPLPTHSHATSAIDAALAKLDQRITALEGGLPPVITPPPAGRPWPLPVTTQTVAVPASIDATGATLVTAALRTFILTVPNGSIVQFKAGGTYKIDASIFLGTMKGKSNVIFDGQGCTLNNVSPSMPADANSSSNKASSFYWHYTEKPFPTHITIRNFIAKAASPTPGVLNGSEFAAFAHFMGGQYLEVDNVTASGFFGDLVTLNEDSQFVYVHDNHGISIGRNSISVVCGSHLLAERNAFDKVGYCSFDIEPEPGSIAGITDIVYRNNSHGTWLNCFFALDGVDAGKPISDVTIDGNTITGKNLLSVVGGATGKARPQRIKFTNNTGPTGGSLTFRHIDSLTVKGNSGTVSLTDCPNAVTT